MISIKYKNVFDEFIIQYEKMHINPWHNVTKKEIINTSNKLIRKMNIDSIYTFYYFINYILKKINGLDDSHTKILLQNILPVNFRIIDKNVYFNYPDELKGYKLLSINGTEIHTVLTDIDEIITYGTLGKRTYELEKALFNSYLLFGLNRYRDCSELVYEAENQFTKEIKKITFNKNEINNDIVPFNYSLYCNGNPESYMIKDDYILITHSSLQNIFEEKIIKTFDEINTKNLSNVKRIIVDLRGNLGGNIALNRYIRDFLKSNLDKKIIVLTDYRVFSSGSIALIQFCNLGAITIGEEISTPINCYGESKYINIEGFNFTISTKYNNPLNETYLDTKEDFNIKITKSALRPFIFRPKVYLSQSFSDYLIGKDTILDFVINQYK